MAKKKESRKGTVQRAMHATDDRRCVRLKTVPTQGRPQPHRLISPDNARQDLTHVVLWDAHGNTDTV